MLRTSYFISGAVYEITKNMRVQQEIAAIQFQCIIACLVYSSCLIVIMAAHNNGQAIFAVVVTIFFFYFSSPIISSHRDWMSTILPHMMWP